MRSSKRYKALDETAVMGSVCRHEIPARFFNLFHGERSDYCFCDAVEIIIQIYIGYAMQYT